MLVVFADGKDKEVRFKLQSIQKEMPKKTKQYPNEDLRLNFKRICREIQTILKK